MVVQALLPDLGVFLLALVSTKAASSGVIISTYTPNGPLRTGAMGEGE